MFGNLKVAVCGLDGSEKELYRSAFCTVCHDLRANSGLLSTLLTNYDSTFWLVMAQGLYGSERPALEKRPCNGFPLKKVTTLSLPEKVTGANTALLWLLAEAKARDDWGDEKSKKAALFLRLGRKSIERFTRLLEADGFPVATLKLLPEKQQRAESEPKPSVMRVAEPTMAAIGEIFGHIAAVCDRPEHRPRLVRFGEILGLAIFLLDALEDRQDDQRKERFNAYLHCTDFRAKLFQDSYQQLQALLRDFSMSTETQAVLSKALDRLKSKFDRVSKGHPHKATLRPLARLKRAGFLLNPFAEKESCFERYCSCDPCCCECGDCCGDGGCDCSCCDCSGCDCCGCAC